MQDNLFLKYFLSYFLLTFNDEPVTILNADNQLIAATMPFLELIGVTDFAEIKNQLPNELPIFAQSKHDVTALYTKAWQSKQVCYHLDCYKYHNQDAIFLVKKKPLINPHTNNMVALLCTRSKLQQNNLLNVYLNLCKSNQLQNHQLPKTPELGVIQAEVLFCLLLGLRDFKYIANFINLIKQTNSYTQQTIKNAMDRLYYKFEAYGNINTVVEKALYYGYHQTIPATLLPQESSFELPMPIQA